MYKTADYIKELKTILENQPLGEWEEKDNHKYYLKNINDFYIYSSWCYMDGKIINHIKDVDFSCLYNRILDYFNEVKDRLLCEKIQETISKIKALGLEKR